MRQINTQLMVDNKIFMLTLKCPYLTSRHQVSWAAIFSFNNNVKRFKICDDSFFEPTFPASSL